MTSDVAARQYFDAVHAAAHGSIDAEEEAQLTTPVSNLFCGLVAEAGLGELQLIRETRTGRTRPDFAALLGTGRRRMQKGYVELKAPSVPVDVTRWRGRNAQQWATMSREAEILIVCNGREAQLYRAGVANGAAASLPYDDPEGWDAAPLTQLLGRFIELNPASVTAIGDLTQRLAVRTRDLRDRIEWLLADNAAPADGQRAARGSYAAWRRDIYPDAQPRDFADGVSQVIAYGMVLATLTPGEGEREADRDGDGQLTVEEARTALRAVSPVLAAAFAPLVDQPALYDAVQVEIGGLETLVSAIDPARIARADQRGDAWLGFYEDFLSVYDPAERREAGVYYTPLRAVAAMTAMTEHLLVERLGIRLGFGDTNVVTLDPATGTGTFPLAAIDRAVRRAEAVRGPGGGGAGGAQPHEQSLRLRTPARPLCCGAFATIAAADRSCRAEFVRSGRADRHPRSSRRAGDLLGRAVRRSADPGRGAGARQSHQARPARDGGDRQPALSPRGTRSARSWLGRLGARRVRRGPGRRQKPVR